ncbi:hypothetical protein [Indiicoccus explosivorum]|uniref:hypothetical protein n=1 Tax=Indiicoccus explosivorum TaxID=1917864 RepID=UPI001185E649|nr:hypothetical protein [Indiicoccus explosivorum]
MNLLRISPFLLLLAVSGCAEEEAAPDVPEDSPPAVTVAAGPDEPAPAAESVPATLPAKPAVPEQDAASSAIEIDPALYPRPVMRKLKKC